MRGKVFHNTLANRAKNIFQGLNWRVRNEYRYQKNGITTYFDVYATKDNKMIACEIETTSRHAIDNINKALTVEVDIWVIVPTKNLLCRINNKLNRMDLNTSFNSVKILLFSQLEKEIKKISDFSDRHLS